ncbi:hypothetical protein B0J13DRAFT_477930 [Dactylonectria estremocensis]|uniref:Uncharacterized protein n=1 Tax=Dactylonectria estremocensis TaxID=1079267 RepID=A0A9P9J1B4_9HYPO|nr:hypothetical protein B0J13DRAFT_477930 [Dactylonectria estremocensis]
MDFLRQLLGLQPRRTQPARVETDEIFPVHFFDDTKTYRSMVVTWTLRFDDVLDADKVYDALARLLEIGDWRRLGGRLRLTTDGKLVVHVPKQFTAERPAVRFSHQTFDVTIDEHPIGCQLPKATENNPSVQSDLELFRIFTARKDAPATIEDFLYSDEPQMSLHITSFKDATLVALLWPHTMTSALGRVDLVNAWGLMLAGREDEVAELHGAREDILDGVGTASDTDQEPSVLQPHMLKGFDMVRFGFNFAWELVFGPKMTTHMLYLPSTFVSRLRQRALNDLKSISGEVDPPFVSEGDVLSAWATQMVAKTRAKNRPLIVIGAVDIRSRLKSVFQSGSAYVQNTALGTFTLFKAREAAEQPLGQIAYKFRRDILEQITDPQLRTMMRGMRTASAGAPPPMFGETNSMLVIVSNWTKANFLKIIDFSPAVIESFPVDKESHQPGKMVYQHSFLMVSSPMARNVLNILGKDPKGNYWITGVFPQEWWSKLEEELKVAS